MEPIGAGSEAEAIALEAAQIKEDDPESRRVSDVALLQTTWLKTCCSSIKDSFLWVKNAMKQQATKFISGSDPYRCEISLTTVNFTVICSLVVAFMDQMKYAFFSKEADFAVGVIQL